MRRSRVILFITTLLLIVVGVVMIYSASALYAHERYRDSAYFLKRHLMYLFAGLLLTGFVMSLEMTTLHRYARPLFIIAVGLLILLLLPGVSKEIGGARRWFRLGLFNFQPSEFAKFALVIFLADMLSRKKEVIRNFLRGFLLPTFVICFCIGLILLQPDLGTAVAIGVVGCIMLFAAGVRPAHILSLALLSLPALYLLIFRVSYRRKRIAAFLNPWGDPQGIGFQIIQSFIALGAGGLFGVGLGASKQKLFYLPAGHTDFIFSIIGEELGLLGTFGILLLFIIFFWQAAKLVYNASSSFMQLAGVGLLSMIALEAVINIAVVTGSMPTKGLPLPFISYGGSALLFNMASVGVILNIGRDKNQSVRE